MEKVLSFKQYMAQAISKINCVFWVIYRSTQYHNFHPAVQGICQATPEVQSLCMEPDKKYQKGFVTGMENVQRRAYKMLTPLKDALKPKSLHWQLTFRYLEHRIKWKVATEVHKYLWGFSKVSHPAFHIAQNELRSIRGTSLKLKKKPRHCLNLNEQRTYFANKDVNLWDSINGSTFKRTLDKYWATIPSMYNPECLD